jgi:hypothetical protein
VETTFHPGVKTIVLSANENHRSAKRNNKEKNIFFMFINRK